MECTFKRRYLGVPRTQSLILGQYQGFNETNYFFFFFFLDLVQVAFHNYIPFIVKSIFSGLENNHQLTPSGKHMSNDDPPDTNMLHIFKAVGLSLGRFLKT